jgi:putative component of toxin-antitoxin plasmid stabilization module
MSQILVLICGGDKQSQDKDIEQTKAYWKEYLNHEHLSEDWRS